jgi:HEAT repeat protein
VTARRDPAHLGADSLTDRSGRESLSDSGLSAPRSRRDVAVAGHTGDVEVARRGLDDADPSVRATALGALERLRRLTDDELIASFADADPVVRRRAASIAARHRSVDLAPLLADADLSVVETAAWACGEHERAEAGVLDTLITFATGTGAGTDPLVREAAVAALGAIGDDRGLDAILAGTSDRPAVRRRAVLALAPFLDPDHPRAAEISDALERARSDRDWQVRQAVEDLTD